jgi:hypothetical protein
MEVAILHQDISEMIKALASPGKISPPLEYVAPGVFCRLLALFVDCVARPSVFISHSMLAIYQQKSVGLPMVGQGISSSLLFNTKSL